MQEKRGVAHICTGYQADENGARHVASLFTCLILLRELVMRSVMLWYVRMAVVSSV